ncbi:MAG: RNA polymerase sigma factor [Candidatus Pacearchaeota archaeon]|nr:RNA polymerase sigma factor [Candidatus Pacearchaeota archaeon]
MSLESKCSGCMKEALSLREDIYRFVFSMTKNHADSEDVVQDSYMKFYEKISGEDFLSKDSVRPYLFKVAKNTTIGYIKKRKTSRRFNDDILIESENSYDSRKEDLEYLRYKLGETRFEVLNQLVYMLDVRDDILSSVCLVTEEKFDRFKERLSAICEVYHNGERVILPPGIGKISFDPFHIEFRKNRFNGKPLVFFQKHIDFYEGLSRLELSKIDQPLYNALREDGLLGIAIPEDKRFGKKELSHNESRAILDAYEYSNASARSASKCTGHDVHLIAKHWRENGLEVRKGRSLLEKEKEKIINSYLDNNKIVSHTSRELGYSRKVISNVLRDAGFDIDSNRGLKIMNKSRTK